MSLRRRLGLDRNPLRRPVDRLESAVVLGLAAVLLTAGPVAGTLAGRDVYRAAAPIAAAEQADRTLTTAVVIQDARRATDLGSSTGPAALARVEARYTAPDGTPRTGMVTVGPGRRIGDRVTIWIDGHGDVAVRPRTTVNVLGSTIAAGLTVFAVMLGATLLIAWVTRLVLNRHRQALWASDWQSWATGHTRRT